MAVKAPEKAAAVPRLDYVSGIGFHAGDVWRVLHEKGALDVAGLRKATRLAEGEIREALGWLAREGKVAVEPRRTGIEVRLAPGAA